jgi:uncharacterized membrane protein
MHELVILSFDTPADAEQARQALQQTAGADVVVLPSAEVAAARPTRRSAGPAPGLRHWALLPWRVGSKALGGALTVVTWSSLLVSAASGELAGRLLGVDREDQLREQMAQAVKAGKTPVIMLTLGQAPNRLIETVAQAPDQIYRTRISSEAAARIRSAFSAD